jgi:hypothetical protein
LNWRNAAKCETANASDTASKIDLEWFADRVRDTKHSAKPSKDGHKINH